MRSVLLLLLLPPARLLPSQSLRTLRKYSAEGIGGARMAAYKLVLIRHGESSWNQENRFCGWFDADLSEKGVEEARRGALAIKEAGLKFDVCYTSVLKRAVKTLWTIMEGTDQMWLPVIRTWRLNERHYGGLTGLNKAETAEKHGEEQVKIWRRSFDIPPPPMDADHAYHKIISQVRRSRNSLTAAAAAAAIIIISATNTVTTAASKCVWNLCVL